MKEIQYEGLDIQVSRSEETGMLVVDISTSGLDPKDVHPGDDVPNIRIMVNEAPICFRKDGSIALDYEPMRGALSDAQHSRLVQKCMGLGPYPSVESVYKRTGRRLHASELVSIATEVTLKHAGYTMEDLVEVVSDCQTSGCQTGDISVARDRVRERFGQEVGDWIAKIMDDGWDYSPEML